MADGALFKHHRPNTDCSISMAYGGILFGCGLSIGSWVMVLTAIQNRQIDIHSIKK